MLSYLPRARHQESLGESDNNLRTSWGHRCSVRLLREVPRRGGNVNQVTPSPLWFPSCSVVILCKFGFPWWLVLLIVTVAIAVWHVRLSTITKVLVWGLVLFLKNVYSVILHLLYNGIWLLVFYRNHSSWWLHTHISIYIYIFLWLFCKLSAVSTLQSFLELL